MDGFGQIQPCFISHRGTALARYNLFLFLILDITYPLVSATLSINVVEVYEFHMAFNVSHMPKEAGYVIEVSGVGIHIFFK